MLSRPAFPAALAIFAALLFSAPPDSHAQTPGRTRSERALDAQSLRQLEAEAGGAENVSLHPATSVPRFVRLGGLPVSLSRLASSTPQQKHERSLAFLREYAALFGIGDPAAALRPTDAREDALGDTHITYVQQYRGVPVFAGVLKTHFNRSGELTALSGTVIPHIAVNATPSVSGDAAAGAALAVVIKGTDAAGVALLRNPRLYIYRTGLARGVEGENYLAWEVEIGNGHAVRQLAYVDAHTGAILDRVDAIQDGKVRRAYSGEAAFPAMPFWVEGDPFPTGDLEANNLIQFSGETYDLFANAFGRDSFDGAGATMHGVFRRTAGCPNASWNGIYTSYCAGVSTDDVVGHEWGHAYTEFTHGLIYQWQPGALNESYSDIFGEIVDLLNGTGRDSPGGTRTAGLCSAFTPFSPVVRVNSPASIAGVYPAGRALFGPALTAAGLTGDVVLVDDGVGNPTPPTGAAGNLSVMDGCETPFVNGAALGGKIALMYRGTCPFAVKVKNAQLHGAVGVIISNHAIGGNGVITMSGVDATITIPSASVGVSNGDLIRSELGAGVNATLRVDAPGATEDSYRWLVGEDSTAFGGAIRDMWQPTCYSHPGKVSDTEYVCSAGDAGGVHSNSGVPNHGFALLADGGAYNGQTVAAIGLVKAAHLYYRAMTVYQSPSSDFADHADALEQSCADLTGASLKGFDGAPTGESITTFDCTQVANMIAAVELRTPPTQCGFEPLLTKNPPDRCEVGTTQVNIFQDTFELPSSGWTTSHTSPSTTFTPRDWQRVSSLPDRDGFAFFGVDPNIGQCTAANDQSGVLHLDSPAVSLASGVVAPRLTFDHWVSTEATWDGGNLKVSVGSGPWQVVAPADFTFNSYNATLAPAPANTNPLAGQPAFTGSDGGSVLGSWGRSHVNLAPYVGPGQQFSLRFDMGTDGCTGLFGWYVDDVTVYACASNATPTASINDVAVTEGNHGVTNAVFTVTLSHVSSMPVELKYKLENGTAKKKKDYLADGKELPGGDEDDEEAEDEGDDDPKKGVIVIPPLAISGEIMVRVVGDLEPEPDETFFVILKKASNATIVDGSGQGTIVNDDGP